MKYYDMSYMKNKLLMAVFTCLPSLTKSYSLTPTGSYFGMLISYYGSSFLNSKFLSYLFSFDSPNVKHEDLETNNSGFKNLIRNLSSTDSTETFFGSANLTLTIILKSDH